MNKLPDILPSASFYDVVADSYNSHMTDADHKIRERVRNEFKTQVADNSIVLDFGGGTGLDLHWLTDSYEVFFLEPSENMRFAAKKVKAKNKVSFIEENTDFNVWNDNYLPFCEKVTGILMNFAVLNCIKSIDALFDKLALVSKTDCTVIATVIHSTNHILFKDQPLKLKLHNLFSKQPVIYQNHNGVGHETYIHSVRNLKSAARRHFNFISYIPLTDTNFAILTLSRK